MTTRVLEEMYFDIYKVFYKTIISKDESIMLEEFKKFINNEDNGFMNFFEKYKHKSFEEYERDSIKKEKLGNIVNKFFIGESLDDEEITLLSKASAKEKVESFELISFSKIRKDREKRDNFLENERLIREKKSFDMVESLDFSYSSKSYLDDITSLGIDLFKYYNGEYLSDKSLKNIASAGESDKMDSMIFVAPTVYNLENTDKYNNFIDNEERLESIKNTSSKIKKKLIGA